MSSEWKSSWRWTALGSVLLLGTSLGVLADRLILANADEEKKPVLGAVWFDCSQEKPESTDAERSVRRARHLAEVGEALSLDAAQREAVDQILEEHGIGAREFWDETRTDYCSMLGSLRDDVRSLLRPEQKGPFEERIRRIDESMRARHQRSAEEAAE